MTTALTKAGARTALAPADREMTDCLAVAYGALEPDTRSGLGYLLSAARSPSAALRVALEDRRLALSEALEGCEPAVVVRSVGMLRSTLASEPLTDKARELVRDAYCAVLCRYPAWAVEEASLRFLEGLEGDGKFAPKPPEIAAVCRKLVEAPRAEVRRIEAVLSAKVIAGPTEEERRQVAERAAAVRRDLMEAMARDGKVKGRRPPEDPFDALDRIKAEIAEKPLSFDSPGLKREEAA